MLPQKRNTPVDDHWSFQHHEANSKDRLVPQCFVDNVGYALRTRPQPRVNAEDLRVIANPIKKEVCWLQPVSVQSAKPAVTRQRCFFKTRRKFEAVTPRASPGAYQRRIHQGIQWVHSTFENSFKAYLVVIPQGSSKMRKRLWNNEYCDITFLRRTSAIKDHILLVNQ